MSYAVSTQRAYSTHRNNYLEFCEKIKCNAVPVTTENLCRYAAYLGRTKSFASVQQYLNIIRVVHLEMGFANPLKDNFALKSVLAGLKRGKGAGQTFKLPLNPLDLLNIRKHLVLSRIADSQIWAVILCCFYGLFRVSNVAQIHKMGKADPKVIRRQDLTITQQGCIITVFASKTLQFKDRSCQVPIPYLQSHPLCPTSAIISFLSKAGNVSNGSSLFSVQQGQQTINITQTEVRKRLNQLCSKIGLPSERYGTHSLRRGGATWMFLAKVPLQVIKTIGDWKSDCVLRYITPDINSNMDIITKAAKCIPKDC